MARRACRGVAFWAAPRWPSSPRPGGGDGDMGLALGEKRGLSGFGSASTAEDVAAGVDASHLTTIVTGATNGIGKETARVLALRGANVIIPARTLESGMKVKESLAEQVPGSKVHVMEMDLSSLDSVRSFTRSFNSSHKHLNILMQNKLGGCQCYDWYNAEVTDLFQVAAPDTNLLHIL